MAVVSFHITFAPELRAHQQMQRASRQKMSTRGCSTVSARGPLSPQNCSHPSDTHTPHADWHGTVYWRTHASFLQPVPIRTVPKLSLGRRATHLSLELWGNSQAHFKEAGKRKWRPRSQEDDFGCRLLTAQAEASSWTHMWESCVAACAWNLSTGDHPWDSRPARPVKTSKCIILSETLPLKIPRQAPRSNFGL